MADTKRLKSENLSGSFIFTGNIDELARCRNCFIPLYCIYDMNLRLFCHDCDQAHGLPAAGRSGEA